MENKLKPDPINRICLTCLSDLNERIPLDSEGVCHGCGEFHGKAVIVPTNPQGESSWSDWPEESFDDPRCECASLENHTYCQIHGKPLDQYRKENPQFFHYEVR